MNFNKLLDSIQSPDGAYYLGDPWRLGEKGLTILVPIRCKALKVRSYILASENKEKVNITDTGKIDELVIDNKSGSPIFVRGGTVFKGKSGQDRATVQGVVIQPVGAPDKSIPIAVKCVHAHRGITPGGNFAIMEDLAPNEVYTFLQHGDQHKVWNAVASYSARSAHRLRASGVGAQYSASLMSDPDLTETLDATSKLRTDFSKSIMEALSKVPDYDDQVGVGIITVDGVQGLEMFDSPESWKALGKEVVKSFAEIFHQEEGMGDLFTLNMDAVKDKIRSFLKELDGSTFRTDDGTFDATDNKLIICEYTNLNGDCIHVIVSRRNERYPPPDSGNPLSPDILGDMFGREQHRSPRENPRRYNDYYYNPWLRSDWVANDMDSTAVLPVKKPRIGDGLIFGRLMEHSYSFNDLKEKTGIPSATLARRLNEYTDGGYIAKTDENGHAKWKLTAKGTVRASERQA